MTGDAQRAYDDAQRAYDEVEARRARMEARDIFDRLDGVPVHLRRVNDAMRDEIRRAWNAAQRDLFKAQDALLKARRDQGDNDPWFQFIRRSGDATTDDPDVPEDPTRAPEDPTRAPEASG